MPAQIPTNPESSTTMTIQYTARQLDALNERALYGVACEQMNEARLDNSRWQMSEWHPDGAHLWNGTGLNIVVTSFTTDHVADFGIYTDRMMEEMNDTVLFTQCALHNVGETIHALMDVYGEQTDLMHEVDLEIPGHPLPLSMQVLHTDPLPAPLPTAVELAADYIRMVRTNGPECLRNVAGCYDLAHGHHDTSEVRYEVGEMLGTWEHYSDEAYDLATDVCHDAALLAIAAIRDELVAAQ